MSARRWIPWLTFLVVLICTLAVAAAIYRVDNKHREADFAFAAAQELNRLAAAVHMRFRPVQHVATTFSIAAGELDARQFDNLVNSIPLADSPALLVLQWWVPEPMPGSPDHFGLRYGYSPGVAAQDPDADLSTIPRGMFAQAKQHGGLFIGSWYEALGEVRFRVLRPVFSVGPAEPRLLGFVSGVYRVDRLLGGAICANGTGNPIEVIVSDPRAMGTGELRCLDGALEFARSHASPPGQHMTIRMPVDGVDWAATAIATGGAFSPSYWTPAIIMAVGFALATTLALFQRSLLGREDKIALLVRRRTEELARRTDSLNKSTNELATVYGSAPVGLAVLDRELRYRRVNDRMAAFDGVPVEAHIGRKPGEIASWMGDTAETVGKSIIASGESVENFELQSVPRSPQAVKHYYNTHWLPLKDDAGYVWGINMVVEETTERRQLEARARHLAEHDPLTDLPNRRLLLELLVVALRSAQRSGSKVAVLFLDLDHFKAINDTLGHEVGDALLRAVASRLAARMRRSDLVARLGGDEFVLVLGDLTRGEQVSELAEAIVRGFQQPFHLTEQSLYITTSVGISLYPDDSDSAEDLLRRADLAMYEAKGQGRNTYRFYNPAIDRRARERAQIERSLRDALTSGALKVLYQPELDLRTGSMIGVEALLRWEHPELGVLEPEQFIPVAEETDLIVSIDDWVLRTACAQARAWIDEGYAPINIGVNLSTKGFERLSLVQSVRDNLAESGMAAAHLELELTERTIMRHIGQSVDQMRALVALGVGIAIDDFGTGYSSLSYLKRLPIRKLKIDHSFIHDIATDPDDRAIIQAVTALAHTLNKRVVAEGVETREQRDFLANVGCDEVQGFLFSTPLPPEQVGRCF